MNLWIRLKNSMRIESQFNQEKGGNNVGKGGDYEMYCKYRGITEDIPEGRYYLGGGLWSHPETGGDFYFEDERKNH